MAEPLLVVDDLRVSYRSRGVRRALARGPAVAALDGVSFVVEAGECLGIVGESGSGKSTLARTLVGLVRPEAGVVRFAGTDVTGARGQQLRAYRRQVQMVFQDPYSSVNPRFAVRDVIGEPLEGYQRLSRADRRRRVGELLERVHLASELADRRVTDLSGGQLQRVGIARALAVEPRLLIADEPVSALDVSVQAQVLEVFIELKQRDRIASIFITHNLAVAEYVADRIAVMQAGQIVEIGPAEQLIADPQHPYTQQLVRAVPVLHG